MNFCIDPTPTVEFHNRLAEELPARNEQFAGCLAAANEAMCQQRMFLAPQKPLEVALSALLLQQNDITQLQLLAENLHRLIEHVLDVVLADPQKLHRCFPDQRRIFPFLAKTRGVDRWQVVARYDVAVTPDGGLKIMELNTACPGAFLISEAVTLVTEHGFEAIHQDLVDVESSEIATVVPRRLRDELLNIEERSGIEKGAIGILNDENELVFELDHLVQAFRARDRHAIIADARQLQLRDGRLYAGDTYLSMVYNKFRISTPHSPNHCWRPGFESRYAAFLEAQQSGHVVSINNLVGLAIAENKALLGLLHDEAVLNEFDEQERQLIREHVLWTARLEDAEVDYRGQLIDLLPFVKGHRERFVIKPANEGRGFGVVIGRHSTPQQWEEACRVREDMPQVVQEYVEALTFPVICNRQGKVAARPMYLTLGLATIDGRYVGLVSRVSANAVTNVAREGYGQAVFVGNNHR